MSVVRRADPPGRAPAPISRLGAIAYQAADRRLVTADVPIWFSFFAPAGVPKDIIRTLNAKMIELAKTEEMKAALWAVNAVAPLQTPEEMAKDLEIDSARNAEIIKAGNIKME